MPSQRLILDSPEAVAIVSPLIPSLTVCYANGSVPEEWRADPDVVVFGQSPEWVTSSASQLSSPRIRTGHGDIASINPQQPVAWLQERIRPYPAPPQENRAACPPPSGGAAPEPADGAGPYQNSPEDALEPPQGDDWFDGVETLAESAPRSIREKSALKRQAFSDTSKPAEWADPADFWASRPLPPFDPAWILPCVRPFVVNNASMIGCDPGIPWLQLIAFAAGCLSDDIRVRVRPSQNWAEAARIWACIVGDSGDGKSPSMLGIMREARDLSMEIARSSKERQGAYKDEFDLYELERKAWLTKRQKGEPAGPRPNPPAKPVNEMLYFNGATSEGLLEQQEATTRGTMCYADEFLGWLLGMDQYKAGGKGSDRQFWLSSWDGAEFVGVLVGKLRTIHNTGCTIVGGSQPDAIRRAATKLNLEADGLLQRVLVYHSQGEASEDSEQPADLDAIRRWRAILHRLYAMKTHLDHCVISEAGHAIRRQANEWISNMRGIHTLPAAARQALSKWRAYLPRIALTLHAIEAADQGSEVIPATIEEHTMACAWAYMRDCLWPHLLHMYSTLDQGGEDAHSVRSFAEYVLARDFRRVRPHSLASNWSHYRRTFKTIQQRREFWAQAEQSGWVRPIGLFDRANSISSEYEINPLAFDGRFAAQVIAAQEAAERYRLAMHPAFLRAQGREPGED